jgi:hypothetical protein
MTGLEFGIFTPSPVQFSPKAGYIISVSTFITKGMVECLLALDLKNQPFYIHHLFPNAKQQPSRPITGAPVTGMKHAVSRLLTRQES